MHTSCALHIARVARIKRSDIRADVAHVTPQSAALYAGYPSASITRSV